MVALTDYFSPSYLLFILVGDHFDEEQILLGRRKGLNYLI